MPDPKSPEEPAGYDKQQSGKRQKHIYLAGFSANQIKKRIILKKGKGNDIGQELQNLISIDSKRVHAELPAAVGENIHEFQSFCCEKAEGGIHNKQTGEYDRA
jgi:hypothetical protein